MRWCDSDGSNFILLSIYSNKIAHEEQRNFCTELKLFEEIMLQNSVLSFVYGYLQGKFGEGQRLCHGVASSSVQDDSLLVGRLQLACRKFGGLWHCCFYMQLETHVLGTASWSSVGT